ncbi:hypothetical protein OH809_09735 [Streptomyces sp. NBC_00873]|uniref:hypothetical protein n=1 Tax=unclassified Streptomyces TaxID=2593676 RepID=UPI00386CE86A|nr:hypothetical protein OH809_09735 [Streptomyces sp. NBC_00873]WTA47050.1 hypothetical protein OH821_34085 [Streptomyces sp. NBC_00842]
MAAGADDASPEQARMWALRAVDATPPGHRLAGAEPHPHLPDEPMHLAAAFHPGVAHPLLRPESPEDD